VLLWRTDVRGGGTSSPLLQGEVVYAPGWIGQRLTAIDVASGTVLWTRRLCHPGTPALAKGALFVPIACNHAAVIALDPDTGERLWRTDLPAFVDTPSPPVVANGVVYVATTRDLVMLDASNGLGLKVLDLGEGQIPGPTPIVANGMIFVGSTYSRDAFYGIGL